LISAHVSLDAFSQFDDTHRQVTNSFNLLLICIADMINRKVGRDRLLQSKKPADIINFTSSLSILFSVFFTLLFKTGSETP
jgi:hypothetical protein